MIDHVPNNDTIIKKALDMEACAMLFDLMDTPMAAPLFMAPDEHKMLAVSMVADVLAEEVNHGTLKVIAFKGGDIDETLLAYAMYVAPQQKNDPVFIQKLWVRSDSQKLGLGSALFDAVEERAPGGISALVVHTAVPFFKKRGLSVVGAFAGIQGADDYTLSSHLYAGTTAMAADPKNYQARMFLLPDEDLHRVRHTLLTGERNG